MLRKHLESFTRSTIISIACFQVTIMILIVTGEPSIWSKPLLDLSDTKRVALNFCTNYILRLIKHIIDAF